MRPITSPSRELSIGDDDRAVPIGGQIDGNFIEQRVAQEVMGVQYQTGLAGGVDNDDPLLAGKSPVVAKKGSSGERANSGSTGRSFAVGSVTMLRGSTDLPSSSTEMSSRSRKF